MKTVIGIQELKNQASQIVRTVREEMVEYVITLRGEPLAVLRPVTIEETRHLQDAEVEAELSEMQLLAKEVAAVWSSDKTGVELIDKQRR